MATVSTIMKAFGTENFVNKGIVFQYSIIAILTYIVKKLYFIIFVSSSGQTLGKMCFRIKVVNEDGGKVTFWNALYRETIGRFLTEVVYFMGYIGVFVDREKRAIHDWLCDTRVIYDTNINNEPLYNRQLTPVNRNIPVNNYVAQNNYNGSYNNMYKKQQIVEEQNVAQMLNQVAEEQNIAEMQNQIMEEQNVAEMQNQIIEEQNVVEVQNQIRQDNIVEVENNDTVLEEVEENNDIVSAYGKDLDYSTEFVIEEDDSEVSYDTTELDELLDRLNGNNEQN